MEIGGQAFLTATYRKVRKDTARKVRKDTARKVRKDTARKVRKGESERGQYSFEKNQRAI